METHEMLGEEKEKEENEWKSCCFKADRKAIKYFTQVFFGVVVIGFSMLQLNKDDVSKEKEIIYFSLLSSTVAMFLPSPSPH